MTDVLEPGSFRDPTSTVFYRDGEVRRRLTGAAVGDWEALAATRFFAARQADGSLVGTAPSPDDEAAPAASGDGDVTLRHERIPVVSYPYEWTFAQLRDAALLHLDLLLDALDEGLTMKDGYAYNVAFRGAVPVFIDVSSFERSAGGPWAGYRQFCQTFLYPLMLRAYRDVPFRPWLRGAVGGIEPREMAALLSARDLARPGVLKHVRLHSAMDARFARTGGGSRATATELRDAGFSAELARATVRGLRSLVAGLRWAPGESAWTDYQATSTYTEQERQRKAAFVRTALGQDRKQVVWDLGCNDGTYSRMAAETTGTVVAVDGDEATVDALYRRLHAEGETRVLPLVMDLADPSPGLGWRGRERLPFPERSAPDAVLCLALLHHLALSANLPLPAVLDWLAGLGGKLVVEFVDPADPMAARLLANKPAGLFPGYRRDAFEALLAERFAVEAREELPSGTRTLYAAVPRG